MYLSLLAFFALAKYRHYTSEMGTTETFACSVRDDFLGNLETHSGSATDLAAALARMNNEQSIISKPQLLEMEITNMTLPSCVTPFR